MATVDILLRTPGGPAAAGPSGGAPPGSSGGGAAAKGEEKGGKDPAAEESKKGLAKVGSHLKGAAKFFSKNLGLQFGLSSMLKQSQVFTSFIGVIFQLMGALIDVILAPLLPLFFPVIRMIGSWIPYVQKFMEAAVDQIITWLNVVIGWYDKAKNWLQGKYDEFKEAWKAGPKDFALAIWELVWGGITWVWEKLINTAFPWIWDQIEGMGDKIWKFLTSGVGRIVGWFVQAYIVLGFVKAGVNKIAAWSVGFGVRILRFIGAKAIQFLVWGIKLIPKLIGLAWRVVAKLIKVLFPGFGHIIVAIVNAVGRLVRYLAGTAWKFFRGLIDDVILRLMLFRDSLMKWVRNAPRLIPSVIKDFVTSLMSSIKRFFAETVKNLLTKLGALLGRIPIIGGTLKKLGGLGKSMFKGIKGISGGVSKAMGGKSLLGNIKALSKMSKVIPVLGSVATLGFGAVETYNNFKNHGWKAGLATAGKTIAATTLAATGNTVASMALDVGGTLAINKFLKEKIGETSNAGGPTMSVAGMAATGGATTVVNIQTANGETIFEQMISAQTDSDDFSFDLSNELEASEQT